MKELTSLKDLLIMHLQSLHDAETQWAETLKENQTALSSTELRRLFEKDRKKALAHAEELKDILHELDKTVLPKKNAVAAGLSHEMEQIRAAADTAVIDAAMIVTQQCMNHYLIAKYGTLSSFARLLLHEDIAARLHSILLEEKSEDEELSRLAEEKINAKAKASLIL